MAKTVTLRPLVSEKAYALSQSGNTYTFRVPAGVNRQQVAGAVAEQYKVTVESVRMANLPGKTQRTIRRGRIAKPGQRNDVRKAYVSLKEGDTLPIFASEEDDKKAAKTKEKK